MLAHTRPRALRSVILLVSLTLAATACGGGADATGGASPAETSGPAAEPTPPTTPPAAPSEDEVGPVPEILRFAAPRLGGGEVVGAELAGAPVALWFWAPW